MYLYDPDIKYNRNFIAFVKRRSINEAINDPRNIHTRLLITVVWHFLSKLTHRNISNSQRFLFTN
jgi:hypothetical protein